MKSPENSTFEQTFTVESLFYCPQDLVYKALKQADKWPKYLPHVESIEMIYDDGTFQEFTLDILSADNKTLSVRSVRKCQEQDQINFFQPKPPVFLKHHAGEWTLKPLGPDQTAVLTTHSWNLNPSSAKAIFPAKPRQTTEDQVMELLREHAEFALTSWKDILEGDSYED